MELLIIGGSWDGLHVDVADHVDGIDLPVREQSNVFYPIGDECWLLEHYRRQRFSDRTGVVIDVLIYGDVINPMQRLIDNYRPERAKGLDLKSDP